MIRTLVVRGLAAGALAGLLAALCALLLGEPRIDDAIALEQSLHTGGHEHELVGRGTQHVGLVVGSVLAGLAFGGLFGLLFAAARGRLPARSDRELALALAAIAFLVIVLVPFLKYPANPPSVGDPDTIGRRTALYLVMLGCSLAALVAAIRVAATVRARRPAASLPAGAGTFLALVVVAWTVLPGIDEVPRTISAHLLWEFRMASLATLLTLWTGIGALFALLGARAAARGRAAAA